MLQGQLRFLLRQTLTQVKTRLRRTAMPPPSDPLDDLLRTWRVPAEAAPRFLSSVRTRLAGEASLTPWERLAGLLFRPLPLSAAAAVAMAAGVLLALAGASRAGDGGGARADYVRSINPFIVPPAP